jgi:poly(A) polymerase
MKEFAYVISRLKAAAQQTNSMCYVVGGAVRDIISLKKIKDVDVVVTVDPKTFASALAKTTEGAKSEEVPAPFPLWTVDIGDVTVDVVQLRGKSLQEDIKHRNFTINAIYYDVVGDRFEDPTGRGFADLYNGVINTVALDSFAFFSSSPHEANSIFIAIRLVADSGFRLSEQLKSGIRKALEHGVVPVELSKRSKKEILRARLSPHYKDKALPVIEELGLEHFYQLSSS